MTCRDARELISARVDGELDERDAAVITAHLASCPDCRVYEQAAFALRRSTQMRAVDPPPTADERRALDVVGSLRGLSLLRGALFVIGGTLMTVNLGSIVSPATSGADHLSRHNGIFGAALGIGMLAVAVKPHRAIGLVPVTSVVALLMAVVAAADVVNGKAELIAEAEHVLEFAGLICLWVISGGPSRVPRLLAALTSRRPAALGPSPLKDLR